MEFKASLGSSAKIISIGISVLFFGGIISMLLVPDDDKAILIVPIILLLVLAVSYYFSIRSYIVTADKIEIRRPFDSLSYDISRVSSAQRIDKKDLRFVIRTFGIGGLFSHTGEYWNKKLGNMTWYVTRTDTAIMLTMGHRKLVVSPDEPEQFIAALKL